MVNDVVGEAQENVNSAYKASEEIREPKDKR